MARGWPAQGKPKVCEGRRHMFQMPILKLTPQLKHRGLIYAMEDHDLKSLTASPEKTINPYPYKFVAPLDHEAWLVVCV